MKLVDELVTRATEDDEQMGQLAEQQAKGMDRRKAYAQLEHMLEEMSADGYLDEGELKDLMARFRAEGLDTKAIQKLLEDLKDQGGTKRAPVTSGFMSEVRGELEWAKSQTAEDPLFQLKAQTLINDYNQAFDTASRALKAEHEIYMTAIRHLVA